jgi:hypothetical protein
MPITISIPVKNSITIVLVTEDGRTFIKASGTVPCASFARNLYATVVQDPSTNDEPPSGIEPLLIPPEATTWSYDVGNLVPGACCGSVSPYCQNYLAVWLQLQAGGFELQLQPFRGQCQRD